MSITVCIHTLSHSRLRTNSMLVISDSGYQQFCICLSAYHKCLPTNFISQHAEYITIHATFIIFLLKKKLAYNNKHQSYHNSNERIIIINSLFQIELQSFVLLMPVTRTFSFDTFSTIRLSSSFNSNTFQRFPTFFSLQLR